MKTRNKWAIVALLALLMTALSCTRNAPIEEKIGGTLWDGDAYFTLKTSLDPDYTLEQYRLYTTIYFAPDSLGNIHIQQIQPTKGAVIKDERFVYKLSQDKKRILFTNSATVQGWFNIDILTDKELVLSQNRYYHDGTEPVQNRILLHRVG